MTPRALFAYGTLQDSDILDAVLGRAISQDAMVVATLAGFRSVYYPGRVYPALLASPEAKTDGILIHTLTAEDWAALDAFEGDEYYRDTFEAATINGTIGAEVYMPSHPVPDHAEPWTLAHWRLHHKPLVLAEELALASAARTWTQGRKGD